MQAFDDGGRVYEISPAQDAHEVRVQLRDLYSGGSMHGRRPKQTCGEKTQNGGKL